MHVCIFSYLRPVVVTDAQGDPIGNNPHVGPSFNGACSEKGIHVLKKKYMF